MGANDIIRQFNRNSKDNRGLIQKALTSASGEGEALVPEKLEETITNTVTRLSPELAVVRSRFDNQKTHSFNRVTSMPGAGGAMGENASTPTRNSKYVRDSVELKVIRRKGAVTNFLQDSSGKYIDAAAAEMENHLLAHSWDLATYNLYGNELADSYTYGGWERFISTNRVDEGYSGSVPSSLKFLDDMLDENISRQGISHPKIFLMSGKMLSKVSRLLTNVRLNQGLVNGLTQVDIGAGWRLNAYRDVPIIVTAATRPLDETPMGAVIAASAGTGGTITDGEWFFMVAPVTYNGEEQPSAEVSITTSSADSITLSWSKPDDVDPLFYKVYCGTTSGGANMLLVSMISAFTYDSDGTIEGDKESVTFSADPTTAQSSVPTHMQTDQPIGASGGVPNECVGLIDLDEYQGMGKMPYTNTGGDRFGGLVTMKPLAETDDNLPFLIKSYCAIADAYEATSVWRRNLRVE